MRQIYFSATGRNSLHLYYVVTAGVVPTLPIPEDKNISDEYIIDNVDLVQKGTRLKDYRGYLFAFHCQEWLVN